MPARHRPGATEGPRHSRRRVVSKYPPGTGRVLQRVQDTADAGPALGKLGGWGWKEATHTGWSQPSLHTHVHTISILARQGGLTSQFLTEAPKPTEGK